MKNKIRLLLIFTFLIIFSYTLLSNKYLGDVEYMNYANNNYFSEYSLEFKNDDKLETFIHNLINDKKDISISSVDLKNNIIKIASYNDSFKPKIVKGRYFNNDDNNVCIVCENGLYKIGDYYKIDGIEYKIIGLYKEMHLSSDNLVFVDLSDVDYKNSPIIKIDFNEDNLYKAASTNSYLILFIGFSYHVFLCRGKERRNKTKIYIWLLIHKNLFWYFYQSIYIYFYILDNSLCVY